MVGTILADLDGRQEWVLTGRLRLLLFCLLLVSGVDAAEAPLVVKGATTVKFDKGTEPKYIELQIKDSANKLQPEFQVKVWQ